MSVIYHLVPPADWEGALSTGTYRPASLDTEGFIHFSTEAQLLGSATRFFQKLDTLVVLIIPEKRLQTKLKYEAADDGRLFPHYYDSLPVELVEDTRMLFRDAQGAWTWD